MTDPSPAPARELTPTQQRNLALMRRTGDPLVFDECFIDELITDATEGIAELSAMLGGVNLFVNKGWVTKVHGCEVLHQQPDDFAWKPSTAAGFVAHKAIELALNWRGEPTPAGVVDEALARLADDANQRGSFVAGLDDGAWAELRSRAVDRTTKFMQDFPPLPAAAHPVLESTAKWRPAGSIEFSAKVDLAVGKPEGRESRLLIVDFKSGYRSHHHRDDLRFYALLETLRHRVPPRKLATYYLDYAESEAEDVTEGILRAALERTLSAIERHIELTIERDEPVKRVGSACRWCPLNESCTEGATFLRQSNGDE